MSDWLEVTYDSAVAQLDEALDEAADHAHHMMVSEGFDEDAQYCYMQKFYYLLGQIRERKLVELEQMFARVATKH
jgi:hypothetical protein